MQPMRLNKRIAASARGGYSAFVMSKVAFLWARLVCTVGAASAPCFLHADTNALSVLDDPRPGYWLAQSKELGVWWCESGWKIGRYGSWKVLTFGFGRVSRP